MQPRTLLKQMILGGGLLALRRPGWAAVDVDGLQGVFATLEKRRGGRLGIAALDMHAGRQLCYRADERFMLCSTFRLLLVTAILARVDQGEEHLGRRIVFGSADLVSYDPATAPHVGPPGLTVAELCAAAMTMSDGVAANLLLRSIGGPPALTAYVRHRGDRQTKVSRYEPEMNRPTPDHIRDTTTPRAMLANLRDAVLGGALSAESRGHLIGWLRDCQTGSDLLRAGVPQAWLVGDKTGHGNGATNDVAIIWPPQRAPLLISAYYQGPDQRDDDRPADLFAQIARITIFSLYG